MTGSSKAQNKHVMLLTWGLRLDLFDHGIWSIERQEVSAMFNRHHLGTWKQAAIMLALAGSGPILVAPDKTHWHVDITIGLGGCLPARGMAEQAEEGTGMT